MTKKNKIQRILLSLTCACALNWGIAASADDAKVQSYPDKPIRILIGSTAGATTDAIARLYAERMSRHLGQPVMIENRPGAASMLAPRLVVDSSADGYTLLVAANSIMALPNVKNTGFKTSDLVGVAELSRGPSFVVVSTNSPFRTTEDLLEAAKAKPGAISNATTGPGTTSDVIAKLFAKAAGVEFYPVPYTGSSLAVPDVLEQRVDFMVGPLSQVTELIRGGEMRALVASNDFSAEIVDEVPTFADLGFDSATYPLSFGLLAPAGTPAGILDKLAAAVEAARQDEELRTRLGALGQEISDVSDRLAYDAYLRQEEDGLTAIITAANAN